MRFSSLILVVVISFVLLAGAGNAQVTPQVVATPSTVSGFPSQTTVPIAVTLTFPPPNTAGTGTIVVSGLPAGSTTVPAAVTYPYTAGATTASTSFQIAIGATTTPGTYSVFLRDATLGAGSATVTLTVNVPSFTASASPNPVGLGVDGAAGTVTVSTFGDPGFSDAGVTYSFSGFPSFIDTGGVQTAGAPGYPPVSFSFRALGGAVPGTYTGVLNGSSSPDNLKTLPFTVTILQPDIGASFGQPVMSACAGGASVGNTIVLSPLNGYAGTPALAFTSIPAGITVNPAAPAASAMPPGQSIAFTVAASAAAAGPQTIVLNVSDARYGINRNVTLTVNVTSPDFTPSIVPASLSLTAGGAPQSITAAIAPNACFADPNVSVTASGLPAGLSVVPSPASIAAPGYAPAALTIQASANVPPGTYNVTFEFAGSTAVKTVTVPIAVALAPDFAISAAPASLTLAPNESQVVTVSAQGFNGFTGVVNVVAPSVPGVTFDPPAFTLSAGGSQPVTVSVSPGAIPGSYGGSFSATAASIPGTRTAPVAITVVAGPDFALTVSPGSLTVPAGGNGSISIGITPLNGFVGAVTVVAPTVPGITFEPASFTLAAGATRAVAIQIAQGTTPQTFSLQVSGTAAGIAGPRFAALVLTVVAAPDFALTISPSSIPIAQGGTATATLLAVGLNGFNGTISVASSPSAGVTVSPSAFTLTAGSQQAVQITVAVEAPIGDAAIVFTGTAAGVSGSRSVSLALGVGPRPDFGISVSPPALSIRAGAVGTVTVAATGINEFAGTIVVDAPSTPHATFSPASFTLLPGQSQTVLVTASASPSLEPLLLQFTATSPARPEIRTASLLLSILAPPPTLRMVTPGVVVPGTRSRVLSVSGEFFQDGAVFRASDPSVVVESARVVTPSLAELTISVRADAPPGRYLIDVTNPDGGASSTSAVLLVHSRSSIGAPLDVTSAAVVYPADGTMIAPGDSIYPIGLLATTGTGTIIGSWTFDGVPFDRFLVNASAGMPVEVRTRIPIPISYAGGHRLEIVLESPAHLISPSITVVHAVARASDLRLHEPLDGAVIGSGQPRRFRWSLVPNCTGFLVEVLPRQGLTAPQLSDAVAGIRSFRVSDAEWNPSEAVLDELGPGIHRWRVRPVCAGETVGQPTEWQRFATLPDEVSLKFAPVQRNEAGRPLLRWEGGAAGLLYRVEVRSAAGDIVHAALTARPELAVDADLWSRHPGGTVSVIAYGPGGRVLGSSPPLAISTPAGALRPANGIALARLDIASLTAKAPPEGGRVQTPLPRISARWSGVVPPDQVTLLLDRTDVTAVATVTPTSIDYDSLLPLEPGTHTARLILANETEDWSFEVVLEDAAAPAAPSEPLGVGATAAKPGPVRSSLRTTWAVTPIGTVTSVENAEDQARMQVSAQTDLDNGRLTSKLTGDVAMKHELNDPNRTIQESRSWIGEFGAKQDLLQETLRLGYAVPTFLDQTQLLTSGTARGGAQGKIAFPFGSTSYYETFTSRPPGVIAGDFGPRQEFRAIAFEVPTSEVWDFRLIGLRVNDEAGFNSAGGTGDAFGLFVRWVKSPAFNVVVEGARGNFEPGLGSAEGEREGNAFRLGLAGARGTLTWGLNLRSTDAEFVNPANRGFTPGGVPDRRGGDLVLTKMFGQKVLSLQVRRLQDGNASGAILPRTSSTGGSLSFTTMLRQTMSLALSGNLTIDRGDAAPDLYLPETDRRQSGLNATVSEMLGRFSASQTVTFQRMEDKANPAYDIDIASATGSFSGELVTNLGLSAIVSGTRSEGSAAVGTSDQILVSVQPSWAIPRFSMVFQPRAAYNWSQSGPTDFEAKTEQVQALVTFSPPWLGSMVSLQLSSDWSRNRFTGQIDSPGFTRNYAATMSFRWNAGSPSTAAGQPAPWASPNPNPPMPYQAVGNRVPRS